MIKLDNDNKRLRNAVLTRVAELAFEDKLTDDNLAAIPFEIIPGRTAHFRCCVYKEREILAQRALTALRPQARTSEQPSAARLPTSRSQRGIFCERGLIPRRGGGEA